MCCVWIMHIQVEYAKKVQLLRKIHTFPEKISIWTNITTGTIRQQNKIKTKDATIQKKTIEHTAWKTKIWRRWVTIIIFGIGFFLSSTRNFLALREMKLKIKLQIFRNLNIFYILHKDGCRCWAENQSRYANIHQEKKIST